ncbi:MAG: hypothetical protein DRJ40_00710 [Thermoprotei archaeon]|nr:MAG: hypothetical protein DRJ40_00710 [Thermoprotei archaeon]
MYMLAIDTGKTKTIAVLLDDTLNVLSYGIAGPADITLGRELIIRNLSDAINSCLKGVGLSLRELDLIVISWAGLDTKADYKLAENYARELGLSPDKTSIIHDAISAFYTVTWGNPGIAVIAGTGAIAYGMNKRGETARSSGWGWLFGDEGSSSWIALQALNAASRAYDERGEETSLVDRLKEYFGVKDLLDIIPIIYQNKLYDDISAIARIAVIVDEEAQKGDRVARRILERAGYELALSAYSVAKKLGMEGDRDIIVGGVGSVYRSRIVRASFEENVRRFLPYAMIKEPITGYKAVLGSIIYGLRLKGYSIDQEVVDKVSSGIDRVLGRE